MGPKRKNIGKTYSHIKPAAFKGEKICQTYKKFSCRKSSCRAKGVNHDDYLSQERQETGKTSQLQEPNRGSCLMHDKTNQQLFAGNCEIVIDIHNRPFPTRIDLKPSPEI